MKKRIIIIGGILLPLIAAVIFFQFYLEGILSQKVNKALNESVDAQVVWEPENISVSFFRDFPNVSVTLSDIGVINNAPFANQVLFVTDELGISVDPFSIFKSQIRVKGITIDQPVIHVQINEAGQANYDIVKPSETPENEEAESDYNLSVEKWEIVNGTLVYEDMTSSTILEMKHINHNGSGNFTPGEMAMELSLESDSVSLIYDNTNYISDKNIGLELALDIADEFSSFTFRDNTLRVNDFTLMANGKVEIIDSTAYGMDVSLSVPDNEFSDLLSLVPGFYTEDFGTIKTSGTFDFQAKLNGILSDDKIPAFTIALQTGNASFQYEDMPVGVTDIVLDLAAENTTGEMEDTRILLNNLSMMIGQNSFESSLLIRNLRDYAIDGKVKTRLDLAQVTRIFPVEEISTSGIATLDITAEGTYDSIAKRMPVIHGTAGLDNVTFSEGSSGYEITGINMQALIENPSGNFRDLVVELNNTEFLFDGQKIQMDGQVRNLDNPAWKFNANGKIDLAKMSRMFESAMEGVEEGLVTLDIHTEGNMEALDQERYLDLPTSGNMTITGFRYQDAAYKDPMVIENAAMKFDPQQVSLNDLRATFGESDFQASGSLKNYLKYILSENQALTGSITMSSKKLNLDEFMSSEVSADTTTVTGESELLRIPAGLDLNIDTSADQVLVSGISLTNVTGSARIADEMVTLSQLKFNTLGGRVSLSGTFQTRTLPPTIDIQASADAMDLAETATSLDFVSSYLPISRLVSGKFESDLKLQAALLNDLSLDLSTVNADAMVECIKAALKSTPITQQIAQLSGVNESEVRSVEDLMMHINIRDGKLIVDPFDVKVGKYSGSIFGSNGLDGSLAYQMTVNVPAGDMGQKLNQFLADNGGSATKTDEIPLTFGIGGTLNSPEVAILMDEQKAAIAEALKQKATGEAEEAVEDLLESVDDEKTKDLINSLMGKKKDTVARDTVRTDSVSTDAADVKKQALDEVKNLLKRKKKDAGEN